MNCKNKKDLGMTLIEVLIAVTITSIMMLAMFSTYNMVNKSHKQVTNRAKISQSGRDIVGLISRDIRMAGYKYLASPLIGTDNFSIIEITAGTGFTNQTTDTCDSISIIYDSRELTDKTEDNSDLGIIVPHKYKRLKISYKCSQYNNDKGFTVMKQIEHWDNILQEWATDSAEGSYEFEEIQDYIQDMLFIPYDVNGNIITTLDNTNITNLRTVETSLVIKSTSELFKKSNRTKITTKKGRTVSEADDDGHLREIITVVTNTRNIL